MDNRCVCQPSCGDRVCGPDGCGGVCGTCTGEDEICTNGQCGPKGDCSLSLDDSLVGKVDSLVVGNGGTPGEALDVDGDSETCAPTDHCQDGLDNQFASMAAGLTSFVDLQVELEDGLADGSIVVLFEMVQAKSDGSPFSLNFYFGRAKDSPDVCDFQNATCDYYVTSSSLDPVECSPITSFPNASLTEGKLVAGGPDGEFTLTIPTQEGVAISITAQMVQLQGDATLDPVSLTNGLISGVVRKDRIMDAFDMLPPEFYATLPVREYGFKSMMETFLVPDVDTDQDGEPDGISFGIRFTARAGNIVGMEPAATPAQ